MDTESILETASVSDLNRIKKGSLTPYITPYRRDRELKNFGELLKSSSSSLSDTFAIKINKKKMSKDSAVNLPSNVIQRIVKLANVYVKLDFKPNLVEIYKQEFDEDLEAESIKSLKFTVALNSPTSPSKSKSTSVDDKKKAESIDDEPLIIFDDVLPVENANPESLNYETIDKDFWVTMYSCDNVCNLWGVILDTDHFEEVEKLAEHMKSYYNAKTPSVSSVKKDNFYAIHDGSWHRIKCLNDSDSDDKEVAVFFIDRGDQDTFPLNRIHELNPQFRKLPAQAIHFCLTGLEIFADLDGVKNSLEVLMLDKTIYAKVDHVNQFRNECLSAQFYVQDKDEAININDVLLKQITGVLLDTMNLIELNNMIPCQVSYVNEKGNIYLTLQTKAHNYFNKLMKTAVDTITNDNSYKCQTVVRFDSNKIYFAYHHKYSNWFRVQVIRFIDDNLILVSLIDVGSRVAMNRNNFIALDKLCKILSFYPPQAIRVNLEQLFPLEEMQIRKLQEITLVPETLYVKFKIIKDKAPVVQLLQKTNDGFMLSVNDSLVILAKNDKSEDNNVRKLQKQTSMPNDWHVSTTNGISNARSDYSSSRSTSNDNWRPTVNRNTSRQHYRYSPEKRSSSIDRENWRSPTNDSSKEHSDKFSPNQKSVVNDEAYDVKRHKSLPRIECHLLNENITLSREWSPPDQEIRSNSLVDATVSNKNALRNERQPLNEKITPSKEWHHEKRAPSKEQHPSNQDTSKAESDTSSNKSVPIYDWHPPMQKNTPNELCLGLISHNNVVGKENEWFSRSASESDETSCRLPKTKSKCPLIDHNQIIDKENKWNANEAQCIPVKKQDDWKPVDNQNDLNAWHPSNDKNKLSLELEQLSSAKNTQTKQNCLFPPEKESNAWDDEDQVASTPSLNRERKIQQLKKPLSQWCPEKESSTWDDKPITSASNKVKKMEQIIKPSSQWGHEEKSNTWDQEPVVTTHISNKEKIIEQPNVPEKTKDLNVNQNKLMSGLKTKSSDDDNQRLDQQDLMNQLKKVFSILEVNGTTINIVTIEHHNRNHYISKELNPPKVPEGDCFDAHVVLAYDPSHFVVHILPNRNGELKDLMEKMKRVCETYESPKLTYETVQIGQMYATKGNINDEQWYRVFLMKKNKESDSVFAYFCDYGNYDEISIDKLKVLHNRFYAVPYQAIWCELYGIKSPGETWSVENCLRFKKLALGKNLVCSVQHKKDLKTININEEVPLSVETIYVVELIDTSTEEDIYVTNLLVEENHALDIRSPEEKGDIAW